MARKRRRSKLRETVPEGVLLYLAHGTYLDADTRIDVRLTDMAALWAAVGEELAAGWIDANPGTRPWAWWRFTAPRCDEWPEWSRATCPEPRRKLGGSGIPAWERLNYGVRLEFGVPASLLHVRREDPPVFESEPGYLERHGLLEDGERERLPADALEPTVFDLSALPADWFLPWRGDPGRWSSDLRSPVLHLSPTDARLGRVSTPAPRRTQTRGTRPC